MRVLAPLPRLLAELPGSAPCAPPGATLTAWSGIKTWSSLAESEDLVYLDTASSPLLIADSLGTSPGTKKKMQLHFGRGPYT